MSQNGKGDSPRPLSVDAETYKNNWDRAFGKKQDTCEYSGLLSVEAYGVSSSAKIPFYNEYKQELASGMFFERYPNLTGNWGVDSNLYIAHKSGDVRG